MDKLGKPTKNGVEEQTIKYVHQLQSEPSLKPMDAKAKKVKAIQHFPTQPTPRQRDQALIRNREKIIIQKIL
jgi:hypothetical protein